MAVSYWQEKEQLVSSIAGVIKPFSIKGTFFLTECALLALATVSLIVRIFQGDRSYLVVGFAVSILATIFWTFHQYRMTLELDKEPPSIGENWIAHLAIFFSLVVCVALLTPEDSFFGIPDAAIVVLLIFNLVGRVAGLVRSITGINV